MRPWQVHACSFSYPDIAVTSIPYKPELLQYVPCVYLSSPPTRHRRASFLSYSVCLCSQILVCAYLLPPLSSPAFSLPLKSNFDPAYFADLDISAVSCLDLALTPWNCCPRHLCRIHTLSLSFLTAVSHFSCLLLFSRPRPHTGLTLSGPIVAIRRRQERSPDLNSAIFAVRAQVL